MSEPSEELGFELPQPVQASRSVVLVIGLVVVAGAFAFGYLRHGGGRSAAAPAATAGATPVEVFSAKPLQSDQALVLSGVVRAVKETKIYPRTTGYVRRWLVDIGDDVKQGQLLAEIDTPELDAQLAQARAQLAQARAAVGQATAQRDYSQSSTTRFESLADQKLVAKAQVEQTQAQAKTDEANLLAAQSNVSAQEANVRRLTDSQAFAKVTAPFAGTITSRTIELGTALVGDAAVTPMFTLVSTDPVRVYVDVPQTVAPSVQIGGAVQVTAREYAGRAFAGKVERSSRALDPDLHVMTTVIEVPNPDHALMPGMYVQAQLTLPVPHRVFEIPTTALYTDSQGIRLATVDAQHKVHFVKVTIERDTGASLWIATGLTGDEKIVKIAEPSLSDGDSVEIAAGK